LRNPKGLIVGTQGLFILGILLSTFQAS
jgi:hypothetical protein